MVVLSLWFTFLLFFLAPSFALNITVPSIVHAGEPTTLYLVHSNDDPSEFFLKKFYEQNGQSLLSSEAVWVNNFTRNVNASLEFNDNGMFTIHAYATSDPSVDDTPLAQSEQFEVERVDAIARITSTPSPPSSTSEAAEYTATAIATSSGGCDIPVGAIIGVTIVSVIFLISSALLVYLLIRGRKERAAKNSDAESSPPEKGDHDVRPERVARPTLAPHPRSVRNSLISLEARQAAMRDLREQIGSLRRSLAGAFKSAEHGERHGEKTDSLGSQTRLWVDHGTPPPEYLSHRSSVGVMGG
ncbi:uncharacterized protein BT62DRAFT_939119 [Guyanagaster necrorhizus]|uniref:Transmembrane protein n=1 Tax=Guyanagaster necrorhizus TaxID=856835 RepID=A0A9P8AL28_9AGAR|nr:uncharacterized protein BT62DRAFT_939119 [Guyanagaster necrorhizus MCA 3950]KAG7439294.1 hypothetical protein BT62DRAFT_939119 [Guyanagaster necrorhizus MCA 3950]